MLDNVLWKVFEKTGSVDAYLLYADIKVLNNMKGVEAERNTEVKGTDFR